MFNNKILWGAASNFGRNDLLDSIVPILERVRNNDAPKNPAAFLISHADAVFNAKHVNLSSSARGSAWEMLFGMTLAECGVSFDSIKYQYKGKLVGGKPVDIDFHIAHQKHRWFVSLKTSLRERWKTMAYECMTMRHWAAQHDSVIDGKCYPIATLGIFYRENNREKEPKITERCEKTSWQAFGVDAIVSPAAEDIFNKAFACIVNGKSLHGPQG